MYVDNRFALDQYTVDLLNDLEPRFGYNGFGEFIFYRTYSRIKEDGGQENWHDVVIRVIEGTFSIRKDWYLKNHISWDEKRWQQVAKDMAISMFEMKWLPSGRGLFAMGTNFIYERGSMALYSCAATHIYSGYLDEDYAWMMDTLMMGVGVGFSPIREDSMVFKNPKGTFEYIIEDNRESWVESQRLLLQAYMYGASKPEFIYDEIRPEGLPIKGFGGISSGPEPLKRLHEWTEAACDRYMSDPYHSSVIFKTDVANQIGCTVSSGNVRRSAELACLPITDPVFMDIKDYSKYPEREAYGWMSNNSVQLRKNSDFELLPEIAKRIKINGEPGYQNLRNFPKGRIGKKEKVKKDLGDLTNPCGEVILEGGFFNGERVREVCNIDETYPTNCKDAKEWYDAVNFATLYTSTVSLLPTHQPSTNRVVARNRRIGASIVDYVSWVHDLGMSKVIKHLRKGYKIAKRANQLYNGEAGIPEAIRITTIKPGGTSPKLAGKISGLMYPNFHYMIRRVRVARNHPITTLLKEANIPYEADFFSQNTDVFEWPIETNSDVKTVGEVSIWEQAFNLILLQREWADNAVSNTLMFRPKWVLIKIISHENGDDNIEKELKYNLSDLYNNYVYKDFDNIELALHQKDYYEDEKYKITVKWSDDFEEITEVKIYKFDLRHEEDALEAVLASIAPLTKTVSILPHSIKGCYKQMPEEGITKEEYILRLSRIKKIDWSKLSNSDGNDERYCQGEICERAMNYET